MSIRTRLGGFSTASSDLPFTVRGLGIGSSLDEALSRFPDVSSVQWSDPESYRCVYGGDIGLTGYYDAYDANRGGPDVSVSDGWTITRFIFDENDRVCKIEFRASVN